MISAAEIRELFPFAVQLNHELRIVMLGRTLERRLGPRVGEAFDEVFQTPRRDDGLRPDNVETALGRVFLIRVCESDLRLVGELVKLELGGYLFLGGPALNSVDEIKPLGLMVHDFALHDGVLNYLFLLQKMRAASNESMRMAREASKADQVFKLIVEQSNDLILSQGPHGCVSFANPAALECLQISPGETPLCDLLFEESRACWEQACEDLVGGAKNCWVELSLHGKRGDKLLVEGHLVLSKSNWEEARVVGFLRDVSVRKRFERDLLETTLKLRQAQKMEAIGRFAGGIAHDFNNMLGVISASASLLLESIPPADPRRSEVNMILSSTDKGAALARQILLFSQEGAARGGHTELSEQTQSLKPIIERILGESIKLHLDLDEGAFDVEIEPGQYEQVLLNLVLNAKHAMPNGGEFIIKMRPGEEGSQVQLSVSDTGTGMDETTLQHLFEPFYTTKAFGAGSGLGLSVVYGIIDAADGEIRVQSRLREGTRFSIELPLTQAPHALQSPCPPSSVPFGKVKGATRAVVVEDLPELRQLVSQTLESMGIEVDDFDSFSAAIEGMAVREGSPDLLVTDVSLGDGDGLDLAEHFVQASANTKVIITTGHANLERIDEMTGAHGMRLLLKPFRLQELSQMVLSSLEDT